MLDGDDPEITALVIDSECENPIYPQNVRDTSPEGSKIALGLADWLEAAHIDTPGAHISDE